MRFIQSIWTIDPKAVLYPEETIVRYCVERPIRFEVQKRVNSYSDQNSFDMLELIFLSVLIIL